MFQFRIAVFCLALVTSCRAIGESGSEAKPTTRLNVEAFTWAAALINQSKFVADNHGRWKDDHPTRAQQNEFIRDQGIAEYSKWHLAIDERHTTGSKARYKFPFGDFRQVHRCGLLAVKARAHEFGYREIEAAAAALLEIVESARPRGQKGVDQLRQIVAVATFENRADRDFDLTEPLAK